MNFTLKMKILEPSCFNWVFFVIILFFGGFNQCIDFK